MDIEGRPSKASPDAQAPGRGPAYHASGRPVSGLVWVLLSYRVPREPSTPRIAVWRTLKRLGAAQLGDGLVALPADARTREQLEWVAAQAKEAGGSSSVWLAQLTSRAAERALVQRMAAARAVEYQAICARAGTAASLGESERDRLVTVLRGQLRQVGRRDFFPPPQRERARALVDGLAASGATAGASSGGVRVPR